MSTWQSRVWNGREIPGDEDLLSPDQLGELVEAHQLRPSLLIGGDLMFGARSKPHLLAYGGDYPLRGVMPLLLASGRVCVNLEGPFAKVAEKLARNHSYRIHPRYARVMKRCNIRLACIANNHLLDCGRAGVNETLDVLAEHDIACIGGGRNEATAYEPYIYDDHGLRVGVLNYYWNRRTMARKRVPGSARATTENLTRDIPKLAEAVDRVVVIFHWGLPYHEKPFEEDQAFAHLAVDLGANLVVGHHPHVIQPLEIYRDTPIFYSIGNFAFGSGNSKAQGLLLGVTFRSDTLELRLFPLHVKNRDPRIDYQPKVMTGPAAVFMLSRLGPETVITPQPYGALASFRLRAQRKEVVAA